MGTLEILDSYIEKGWKIFIVREKPGKPYWSNRLKKLITPKEKSPYTRSGFKAATNDRMTIHQWYFDNPKTGWGLSTGEANLVVIDVDFRHGGYIDAAWPATLAVRTANSGSHLYYNANGYDVSSGTNVIDRGIDIRAKDGYVVIPPTIIIESSGSKVNLPYSWVNDLPIADLPEDLYNKIINGSKKNIKGKRNIPFNPKLPQNASLEAKKSFALECLSKLSQERKDDYLSWLKVGISLFELEDDGLILWDNWSRGSDKYQIGVCAEKWDTFQLYQDGITIKSLGYWAKEDSPNTLAVTSDEGLKPEDYRKALTEEMGYSFKRNLCNDDVIVNGTPMTDFIKNSLLYQLKNCNYNSSRNAEIAWMYEANQNSFHPIVEYLENIVWNGEDNINRLSSYFDDKYNVFSIWLKRWLIGSVAKVLAYPQGQQNRMLVLDGSQDLGKSYFVRWLARGVPAYHVETPINPEDKDVWVRLMSKWIWEVAELGSTTRKADRELLKVILSAENVTVRKPYGHFDTVKPALSNFIGTINNERGFLNDPTGSRRFMCTHLNSVNWNYAKDINPSQVWAQAVCLFKSGETWKLTEQEKEISNEINKNYEIDNPVIPYLYKYFEIDPAEKNWVTPNCEILEVIKNDIGSDYMLERNIGTALLGMKLERSKRRVKGYSSPISCWIGIKPNGETPFGG